MNRTLVVARKEAKELFSRISQQFQVKNNGRVYDDSYFYPARDDIKTIRKEFFNKLKHWREEINHYLTNELGMTDELSVDIETQKILDRLIFMKVCFDRKIMSRDYLSAILEAKGGKYDALKTEFDNLSEDSKKNGDFFRTA